MIETRKGIFGYKFGSNIKYLTFDVFCLIIFVINVFCLALSNDKQLGLQGKTVNNQTVTTEGGIKLHVAVLSLNIALVLFWLYFIKNIWLQLFSLAIIILSCISLSHLVMETSDGAEDSGLKEKPIDSHEVSIIYVSLTLTLSMAFFLWTTNSQANKLPSSTEEIKDILSKNKKKKL